MLLVTLQAGSGLSGTTTGSVASRRRVSRRRDSDVSTGSGSGSGGGGGGGGHSSIVLRGIRNGTQLVMYLLSVSLKPKDLCLGNKSSCPFLSPHNDDCVSSTAHVSALI